MERNILPDSTAAPALQEKQRELEKHMRADSLEKKLQERPKPEELIKEGILQGGQLYLTSLRLGSVVLTHYSGREPSRGELSAARVEAMEGVL